MRSIFVILCLSLCQISAASTGDADITTEKRTVTEFRDIAINGPFQIIFSNDSHNDFFIRIETAKSLQQYVTVTQQGLSVFVNVKAGMEAKDFPRLIIYVDNSDIHSLTINAHTVVPSHIVWPVICPGAHLKVTGDIPISVQVHTSCHRVSHSTSAYLKNLDYAKLEADIDNAGTTTLSGDVDEADILTVGTGALRAYDLYANVLRIRNTSIASAEVFGAQQFYLNSTTTGHIYYSGPGNVSELKEAVTGYVCREAYTPPKHEGINDDRIIHKTKTGFNTDSLFAVMLELDQCHRKNIKVGDTLHTTEEDSENFACLAWYLIKYGYPTFDEDELTAMFPVIIIHIDNYERFTSIKPYLLKALKEGKLASNTYAYAYDRSLTAAHMRPVFFYWNDDYTPDSYELDRVNAARREIGLPAYPKLLHGKNF